MNTVTLRSDSGREVTFVDDVKASGAMKDIHFGPGRDYVVGFFRVPPTDGLRDRLRDIVTRYRENLFGGDGGEFWKGHFCWPYDIVWHEGRIGVVVPFYDRSFFFEYGSKNDDFLNIRGKDKDGKWFTSASNREKFLDPREKGDWLTHLRICLSISRAVRRLHMAGLAHSDLSYKNVLVDPTAGRACIIDIDGLVVPGKYPPDVAGTPDFIAPEVIATQHLDRHDPDRKLPSRMTDRHALATLIYMYLFYRHPLRGGKVFDPDPVKDEEAGMGTQALFVEHPSDTSNRVNPEDLRPQALPWGDPEKMPYTIAGPLLEGLFDKAFVEGLHAPEKRPSAADWESALVRTLDMIQPCTAKCEMGWYVFDNSRSPTCPYCHTPYHGKLPVLNLYSSRVEGSYRPDNHRLMVWDGQSLYLWHANREIYPNEHLKDDHKRRIGYFRFHDGDWYLVNESLRGMRDITGNRDIPSGGNVRLVDGGRILLSGDPGGRLIQVQMVRSPPSIQNSRPV